MPLTDRLMESWQKSLSKSITCPEEIPKKYRIDPEPLKPVADLYPMRVTPYYMGLIGREGDPIWRQCMPDIRELNGDRFFLDPLNEKAMSPAPGLIHRYPDRVLLLVSSTCATICRFCTRKHQLQSKAADNISLIESGLTYIEKKTAIRDVILSGGDPLLLVDEALEAILSRLKTIPHVEIVRINTRVPVTLPERITLGLCRMMRRFQPLYLNAHFNHPAEITEESAEACSRLADAGIPLGNQTVLLQGVNDDPAVMRELMQKLLTIRVKPYYIHQMDLVKGAGHFYTPVDKGLEIMAGLRGHTSGMANPHYVIDLPEGKGKVPLLPEGARREGGKLLLRNYLGDVVEYPNNIG